MYGWLVATILHRRLPQPKSGYLTPEDTFIMVNNDGVKKVLGTENDWVFKMGLKTTLLIQDRVGPIGIP